MLTPILLALACVAPPGPGDGPAPTPAERRARTLERLRGGAAGRDPLELARVAAAELGPDSRWGRRLVLALEAEGSEAPRGESLEPLLAELRGDLAFVRLDEAPLPAGFPEPTPVGEIVLVTYPGHRLARTSMDLLGENTAFWRLFRHIQANRVAMTAPVEMTYDAAARRRTAMAFLYEHAAQGRAGERGAVEVLDVPPSMALSLGRRGRERAADVRAALVELERRLAEFHPEFERAGEPRLLGYNSPMVPDARRYYEIQLPVRPRPEPPAAER